jgi:hypothetical protein
MTSFVLERRALCISAVATLLAGCGGSQLPLTAPPAERFSGDSLPYHKTFHYTGREQSFKVPLGVKWITVVALGAGGGGSLGGRGGRVSGEIPVKPGERLAVFVGGAGTTVTGGYNGGGPGVYGSGSTDSYGGGDASDVREGGTGLQNRVLVVGGGGGQGAFDCTGYGGGGSAAGAGRAGCHVFRGSHPHTPGRGGRGGTQYSGGNGGEGGIGGYGYGEDGTGGSLGAGGAGGIGPGICGGGGGGGGYYGGGGGGGGEDYGAMFGGGGGGGSSYAESRARKYSSWRGWQWANGNGLIVFSW